MNSSHNRSIPVPEEITVYEYTDLIYFLPLVVVGYLLCLIDFAVDWPRTLGAIWWALLLLSGSAGSFNIPRNVAIFLGVVFLLAVAVVVIGSLLHVSFEWIIDFVKTTCPEFNWKTAFWTSNGFGVLLIVQFIYARFDSKWILNPNRIQHIKWADVEPAMPAQQYKAYVVYPDMLELLLLGAGDIVILSIVHENREVARIKNIPLLWFDWWKVNELLEEMRTREPHAVTPTE